MRGPYLEGRNTRRMWKYILWDLDGTITDSSRGIFNCIRYALETMGCPVPGEQTLQHFVGPPLVVGFQEIMGMTRDEAECATAHYRKRYSTEGMYEAAVYAGIDEVLRHLYETGYRISLASSKPEEYSVRILEHFGLKPYFHEIVGDTLQGIRNSKHAVIAEALRRLNIEETEKADVLMIGDRKYDILGARACGVASLGVYFGFAEPGELEEAGADYILQTVDELLPFLTASPQHIN